MGQIIAVMGVAGSGKTVVARRLEQRGFHRTRFAAPIKAMLKVGLGLSDEQLDGNSKASPIADYGGCSPRVLMQTLGTEWGRRMVHTDIWASAWKRHVASIDGPVVVDDLRFPNEAAAVRAVGGVIWRVYRPGLVTMDHASERSQRNIEEDLLLNNATTLADLERSVDLALSTLLAVPPVPTVVPSVPAPAAL